MFSTTPVKPRMAGQIHVKSSVTSWGGSCTHSRCLTQHTAPYSLHKEGRTTLVLLIQLCVLNGFSEAAIHSAAQERETRQSSCCCSATSQRSHGREGPDCRGDKAGRAGAPSATSYGHRCGLCRCTEEESMRGVNTRGRTRGTNTSPAHSRRPRCLLKTPVHCRSAQQQQIHRLLLPPAATAPNRGCVFQRRGPCECHSCTYEPWEGRGGETNQNQPQQNKQF